MLPRHASVQISAMLKPTLRRPYLCAGAETPVLPYVPSARTRGGWSADQRYIFKSALVRLCTRSTQTWFRHQNDLRAPRRGISRRYHARYVLSSQAVALDPDGNAGQVTEVDCSGNGVIGSFDPRQISHLRKAVTISGLWRSSYVRASR
jgi:hypothetical protein